MMMSGGKSKAEWDGKENNAADLWNLVNDSNDEPDGLDELIELR